MSDTKKKSEPEARKRPKPKRMKAYGTKPNTDMSKPERIADRGGCVFITSAAERERVKRRPRKAARRTAKAEIRDEAPNGHARVEDDQRSPWHYADLEGRGYLTPEDVSAAISAGASVWQVAQAVLEAVESRGAEDASLCAFVVLSHDPAWKRRTRRP